MLQYKAGLNKAGRMIRVYVSKSFGELNESNSALVLLSVDGSNAITTRSKTTPIKFNKSIYYYTIACLLVSRRKEENGIFFGCGEILSGALADTMDTADKPHLPYLLTASIYISRVFRVV